MSHDFFFLKPISFLFIALGLALSAQAQDLAYDTALGQRLSTLVIKEQGELAATQGLSIEKTLEPTERHRFRLQLRAGQYLTFLTINQGIYVHLRLYTADDQLLYEQWRYARGDGTSRTRRAIETSGEYILELAPRHEPYNPGVGPQNKPGNYQLQIEELRAATEVDFAVQRAEVGHNFARVTGGRYLVADLDERRRMTLRQEYEPAIRIGEESLQKYQQLLPAGQPDIGNLGMALVSLYEWRGLFTDRERLEKIWELIALNRAAFLGPNNLHSALAYRWASHNSDPVRGERLIKKALEIVKAMGGEKSAPTVMMMSSWASKLLEYGETARAEELFKQAVAIEKELPKTPENLGDLYPHYIDYAEFLMTQGAYAEAEKLLNYVLTMPDTDGPIERTASAQGGDRHGKLGKLLLLLGKVAQHNHDYTRAAQYFRSITQQERWIFAATAIRDAYRHLGNLYLEQREFAKAEQTFQQGQLAVRPGSYDAAAARLLRDWSKLKLAQGQFDEALKMQQQALEAAERELHYLLQHGSDAEKLKITAWANAQLHEILSLHARHAPRSQEALRLALTAVLLRKGRVQDEIGQTRAAYRLLPGSLDSQLLEELVNQQNLYARLSLQAWQESDQSGKALFAKLVQEIEELEIKLSEASRKSQMAVSLETLQAALPAAAALVEYIRFTPPAEVAGRPVEDRYLAYLLTSTGTIEWFDLGSAATIDKAIKEFLPTLQDTRNAVRERQLAQQLGRLLVKPLRPKLGSVRHVLLAPDGLLNLVPFAALLDERGRELVRAYQFNYLTSGRDLLRLQNKQQSSADVLVFGAPDYDNTGALVVSAPARDERAGQLSRSLAAGGRFEPLPSAPAEAEAVKNQFPQAQLLLGPAATESAIKQVRRPAILHLVTHGVYWSGPTPERTQPENPLLRSWLALAGANLRKSGPNAEEDGILTAYEAAALDLWGTKLVVLSACETGLGEIKNGEGVYGLRRALVLAGAETQVTSLWKVDDRVTRRLMSQYYAKLRAGAGRIEALRQVQLEMLKTQANRHPFYWAGFIGLGEWANLAGERKLALKAAPRGSGK